MTQIAGAVLDGVLERVLAGSRRALAAAVRTKGAGRRHTALAYRLHGGVQDVWPG